MLFTAEAFFQTLIRKNNFSLEERLIISLTLLNKLIIFLNLRYNFKNKEEINNSK